MNSPKLWNKLLEEAPESSVLMGGAILDHLFHKEAHDYDIFHTYKIGDIVVPGNWKITEAHFNDLAWAEEHQQLYLQGVNEAGNNPIGSVYEYLVDGEHKVQLIGVLYNEPAKHMANFDHSLTLCRYSKSGMFIHRKVLESVDDGVIRYVSKNKTLEHRLRSIKRAQAKALKLGGEWKFEGFL